MIPRTYEGLLHELLNLFPCVVVVGVRQCGKTTLLSTLGPEWRHFDMEKGSDFQLISADPDLFLRLNGDRVAIDEAHLLPELFPALRVAIDSSRQRRGRFVLSGSSSPVLTTAVSESLAGRVATIEMAPLSCGEALRTSLPPWTRVLVEGGDSLAVLEALQHSHALSQVRDFWWRGGYPEPYTNPEARFRQLWMDNYLQTYVFRDVARLFPGLDTHSFQRFVHLLGGLSGQILNQSDVARTLSVSQPTAAKYFDIAHHSFLWRQLRAFDRSTAKRLVKHPKGYLRDSGLLHHLLHIPSLDALDRHPMAGRSWEGMVIEELLRTFNAAGVALDPYHYRTSAGAEIDLVLDGPFGLLPVEIKLGQTVPLRSLTPIRRFVDELSCRLGLVINNDESPRLYDRQLIGVPFTHLCAGASTPN